MSELGTVTGVEIEDNGIVRVTVSRSPSHEDREARYRMPSPNVWVVPSVGDVVEMSKMADGTRVAHSPRNVPGFGAPDNLSEGDVAFRLNEETVLHFSKQGNGTYNIDLQCDGTLNILGKELFLRETEDSVTKKVLTEDAVFEYEDSTINDTSDGTGTESTTTKQTTTVANGEKTEVELE